jgi:hypothetical protein
MRSAMKAVHRRPGYDGWVAVGAVVLVAEIMDDRTMSSAWRAVPKWITLPIAAYTLAHLYAILPEKYDAFHWASKTPVPRRPKS